MTIMLERPHASLRERVADFLFDEAEIADAHRYEDWLGLWGQDAFYWMPCNDDDIDPDMHVALIHEDRMGLEDRIRRLSSGFAHTQQPRSRISRVISHIRCGELEEGLVEVRSVFNLTAFRRDRFEIFAGRQIHVLRPVENRFEIVRKTVYLVNNDGYMSNMTFLI
ncbi:3-phenylpropionate/cinnamic acid dioxygenase, small subunit [Sphingobium faniae]|nr:3-phenylpropionate/cinnamic acid dioxygenase, small subunit [Sphingobium faniae]